MNFPFKLLKYSYLCCRLINNHWYVSWFNTAPSILHLNWKSCEQGDLSLAVLPCSGHNYGPWAHFPHWSTSYLLPDTATRGPPSPHLTLNGPRERNAECLGTQGRVPGAWSAHERESEYGAEATAHWDLESSSSVVQIIHIHLPRFPWGIGTF